MLVERRKDGGRNSYPLGLVEIENIILALLGIEIGGSGTSRGIRKLFARDSSRKTGQTSEETRKHIGNECCDEEKKR
jgi:hypothetical protein